VEVTVNGPDSSGTDVERPVLGAAGTRAVDQDGPVNRIDTSVPHPARRYNYWLGGKDHFQADRDSGDAIAEMYPSVRMAALENRWFMRRAVSFLTREAGVRQFLDIGTGIPAPNNTHEVAQAIAPTSRVVYVDNDPIVMSHARALFNSTSAGATAYVEEDLRNYETILNHPKVRDTLDFSEPVALLLIAILHFFPDADDPTRIVSRLLGGLPRGSYLAASNVTADFVETGADEYAATARRGPAGVHMRSRAEFGRFFDGLELMRPGIVVASQWRDEDEPAPRPNPADVAVWAAVGRVVE
jgi:hypothetical protein